MEKSLSNGTLSQAQLNDMAIRNLMGITSSTSTMAPSPPQQTKMPTWMTQNSSAKMARSPSSC